MEKKDLRKLALSLGLVGVVGVGATLAYFTDLSQVLTNNFDMVGDKDNNAINVIVREHAVDDDNNESSYLIESDTGLTSETANDGVSYENLQPGQPIEKDPTVTVKADSVNCYVYAKVTGLPQNNLILTNINSRTGSPDNNFNNDGISTSWKEITPTDATDARYFVYVGNDGLPAIVNKSNQDTTLPELFKYLKVNKEANEKSEFVDIVVTAAAVQSDNITAAEAETEGLGQLGYTAASATE